MVEWEVTLGGRLPPVGGIKAKVPAPAPNRIAHRDVAPAQRIGHPTG